MPNHADYIHKNETMIRLTKGVMTKVAVSCADASATKPLEREPLEAVQWFEAGSDAQWPEDALRLPVVHQSAYKHATGEAVYVDDMAPRRGEGCYSTFFPRLKKLFHWQDLISLSQ